MSLIPPSETLSVEFKSDRKTISDTVISEEIVALANTDGGDLYVGVEDDGSVTGAQPQHRDPIRMTAMIANKTVPPISVRSEILDEELPVLHVEVPRSLSIVATSSGKMLRRRLKEDGKPASVPMYPPTKSRRGCPTSAGRTIPPSPCPTRLVMISTPLSGSGSGA